MCDDGGGGCGGGDTGGSATPAGGPAGKGAEHIVKDTNLYQLRVVGQSEGHVSLR